MKVRIVVYFIVLLLLSTSVLSLSGFIGGSRFVIRPNITEGQSQFFERSLLIKNTNDIPIHINVSVQEEFRDIASVNELDQNFFLQPGENRTAKIFLFVNDTKGHEGNIIVDFHPVDNIGLKVILKSTIMIIGGDSCNNCNKVYSEESKSCRAKYDLHLTDCQLSWNTDIDPCPSYNGIGRRYCFTLARQQRNGCKELAQNERNHCKEQAKLEKKHCKTLCKLTKVLIYSGRH